MSLRSISVICASAVCVLAVALAAQAPPARAGDGNATWVSAPALPPPTPSGATPSPYPVPIGYVGDIEFWQPNRGLLITAGNSVSPEGLYAYDGVNWHLLSTVCGGTDGRIAWAGPDEFWTIADQRPGQVLPLGGSVLLEDVSLCHFLNGQVVGSYAMPLEQPDSYKPMYAAACDSPSDCWFGGALDTSGGAFHLHWDGTNVTAVDSPQDHEIASMSVFNDQIFESVQLGLNDSYGSEDPQHPPLLHVIVPGDSAAPFHSLYPEDDQNPGCGAFCPPLPEYGSSSPSDYAGLSLSSDWPAGPADPQMWGVAGVEGPSNGPPIVLRYADGTWTQVVPNLVSLPQTVIPLTGGAASPSPQIVAAEPNESAAWIGVTSPDNDGGNARVVRIAVNGTSSATVTDKDLLGSAQGVGPRGAASAITCPAAQDCWLGTTTGWLFHLTDGTQLPQDTDPNFAGVITFRPSDGGVPSVLPPVGVFGVAPAPTTPNTTPPGKKPKVHRVKAKPVIKRVSRPRLVDRTVLVISFTVTVKAHVRLVAKRHHRIVAETRRKLLKPGRHTLRLRLDPRRWPTSLTLPAVAVAGRHNGGGPSGNGNVTTS